MGQGTETTVRTAIEAGATLVAAIALGTLLLAVGVEVVRHRAGARRIVGFGDRVLPATSRRMAAAVVAAIALVPPAGAVAGASTADPGAASAEPLSGASGPAGPLREWLTRPTNPVVARPTPAAPPTTTTTTTTTTTPTTTTTSARPPVAAPPVTTPGAPVTPSGTVPPAAGRETVVVRPQDCLWTIAATRLGPGATNAEIDRAWRAIWESNRDRIGADPNLIHPGLTLVVPAPTVP